MLPAWLYRQDLKVAFVIGLVVGVAGRLTSLFTDIFYYVYSSNTGLDLLFLFRTASFLCGMDSMMFWEHSFEIWVYALKDSIPQFYLIICLHNQVSKLSKITTPQRVEGTLISLPCPMNQFLPIFNLWHGALSCWKCPSSDKCRLVINWGTWSDAILE